MIGCRSLRTRRYSVMRGYRGKVPEYVRIVDALPMTVTGKPQKLAMRDRMVEHGATDADPSCGSA